VVWHLGGFLTRSALCGHVGRPTDRHSTDDRRVRSPGPCRSGRARLGRPGRWVGPTLAAWFVHSLRVPVVAELSDRRAVKLSVLAANVPRACTEHWHSMPLIQVLCAGMSGLDQMRFVVQFVHCARHCVHNRMTSASGSTPHGIPAPRPLHYTVLLTEWRGN
jgi:hypothetical protein